MEMLLRSSTDGVNPSALSAIKSTDVATIVTVIQESFDKGSSGESLIFQTPLMKLWLKTIIASLATGAAKLTFLILGLGPNKYPVCIRT